MSWSLVRGSMRCPAVAAAALLTITLGPWAAASAQETKVAVIDVERLLTESKAGQELLTKLKSLGESKQGEITGKQKEIEELRGRVNDGQLSLSEEKLGELQKELEEKLIALRRAQDDAQRLLQKTREDEFKKIEGQLMPIIAKVGEESGYTLIFNKFNSGLLFALEQVDITDQVLQRYNQGGAPQG